MSSKRIQWPDLLKAFAITLVVVGHIVSSYDPMHYQAPVAKWIYSFHMPLFMILSGMFFQFTLRKSFRPMLIEKCRRLLLPLVSWSVILLGVELAVTRPIDEWGTGIRQWIAAGGPLRGYWYLKCLFLYLIAGYVGVKLTKRTWVAALVTTGLFLVMPSVNFSRMMILYFWIGYFINTLDISKIKNGGGGNFIPVSLCCHVTSSVGTSTLILTQIQPRPTI